MASLLGDGLDLLDAGPPDSDGGPPSFDRFKTGPRAFGTPAPKP